MNMLSETSKSLEEKFDEGNMQSLRSTAKGRPSGVSRYTES